MLFMLDKIRLLPKNVINQIAAGEVIQRPSSVVKELLENSLDANSTFIDIVIIEAGKFLIRVIDDGEGMSMNDARKSVERYTTSKIETVEDLFTIRTMGFRGEALSSISAISQIEIATRRENDEIAIWLLIEANELKKELFITANHGTSVSVKNIFYNVPARRNFLRSTRVELRHILEECYRIAIAHPEIRFRLHHNNTRLFDLTPTSMQNRITDIFGKKEDEYLLPVSEKTEKIKIEGFITNPSYSSPYRRENFFFINRRFIKNAYLHRAILNAFQGFLPVNYHPVYFIFFELDPKYFDINIHPTKTEIKCDDASIIYVILHDTIKRALGQNQIGYPLVLNHHLFSKFSFSKKIPFLQKSTMNTDMDYNFCESNIFFSKKNIIQEKKTTSQYTFSEKLSQSAIHWNSENIDFEIPMLFKEKRDSSIFAFQISKKYIFSTFHFGFIIIDQNRAHERILYERFFHLPSEKKMFSQNLLFPISISLLNTDLVLIQAAEKDLYRMGFRFNYQDNILLIKSAPSNMNQSQIHNLFQEIISGTMSSTSNYINLLARTMAIKHGLVLALEDMIHLMNALFSCCQPNYTPSGKKIFFTINSNFFDKEFK